MHIRKHLAKRHQDNKLLRIKIKTMDLKLNGKRALVTGSSSGLGEAIAKFLATEGAHVIIHGRSQERAGKIRDEIIALGGTAELAIGDLATDQGADAVADQALKNGGIDILVNNAGETSHKTWGEATAEDWGTIYNNNVVSYVRMVQRIVPQMKKLGWGRVVHIGGGLAVQPIKEQPHYNATLAARHNMSVSLARSLKDSGITSNVVSPGAIMNPMVEDWLVNAAPKFNWGTDLEEIKYKAVQELIPNDAGRFGDSEEIAAAVAYLCSTYADYISGAVLRVDGGTIRCL